MMATASMKRFDQGSREVGIFNKNVLLSVSISQLISFVVLGFNFYYQIAIFITITQFVLLFFNVGRIIPVRYLIGALYSINYLLVPIIMFEGLNNNVQEDYQMVGNPDTYFAYIVPAMLMLIFGLHLFKQKGDNVLNVKKVITIAINSPRLPFYLVIVGLICNFIAPYMPSETELIFDSIGYFRFVGFFLSLFSNRPFNYMYLLLSYGLLVVTSLTSSLFNDLLNMLFFLGFILAIRYKANNTTKLLGIAIVIGLVVIIQVIKFPLRERVTGNLNDLGKLDEVIEQTNQEGQSKTTADKVADVLMRLDQGWVTARTMSNYSSGGFELQNGKHMIILLKSSVLPRVLAPDKLKVGDPQEFNKYSGHFVGDGTSIALGIMADGFIDFGPAGIFVVFAFGVIISIFIRIYDNMDKKYPLTKLFLPVAFFYVVRPDNDSQAALGALFKLSFVIWLSMIYINNNYKMFAKVARTVK